jgi:hypothetical protein
VSIFNERCIAGETAACRQGSRRLFFVSGVKMSRRRDACQPTASPLQVEVELQKGSGIFQIARAFHHVHMIVHPSSTTIFSFFSLFISCLDLSVGGSYPQHTSFGLVPRKQQHENKIQKK